jgi:hypothetical protein
MGVDATAVVMYGIKFESEEITEKLDDLIEAMYDNDDHDMMVYDQMNGQYLILGHIFSYQDIHSDYEFVEIGVSDLDKVSKDYHTKFMNDYPEWADVLVGKEFKLLSFVHYS